MPPNPGKNEILGKIRNNKVHDPIYNPTTGVSLANFFDFSSYH